MNDQGAGPNGEDILRPNEFSIRVRCLDGRECLPELQMKPGNGECVMFAGEALAYLTAGRIPAVMYRIVPPPLKTVKQQIAMGAKAPLPYLNTVFNLRPRRNAELRTPHHLRAGLGEDRLKVTALEKDMESKDGTGEAAEGEANLIGGMRGRWPWKAGSAYYSLAGGKYDTPEYVAPPPPPKKTATKLKGGFFKSEKKSEEVEIEESEKKSEE